MAVYYNEFDPAAAEWLRELMKAGLIPEGEVDERSIQDVAAKEIAAFSSVHLFAGIGGWPYALRLAGWPDDRPVWTGSCPCQPYSAAGKGEGDNDLRNLWPHMFRLVRECRPVVCFGEQVEGAVKHGWLDRVSADLEGEGYAVGSVVLGAHSVGSPHIRQRLFWVADARPVKRIWRPGEQRSAGAGASERHEEGADDQRGGPACGVALTNGRKSGNGELQRGGKQRLQPQDGGPGVGVVLAEGDGRQQGRAEPDRRNAGSERALGYWDRFDLIPCRDGKARRVEPGTFPLVDGLPGRVGLLRGYGNAICPQVAAEFIQAWKEVRGE